MLGLEPQRRNRASKENANRVTKTKKDPKDMKPKKEQSVKTEPTAPPHDVVHPTPTVSHTPRIKQETVLSNRGDRLTPASMSTTAVGTHHVIQPRLLTPCSDTDVYPTSPALTSSSVVEMLNPQGPYDFHMGQFGHDQIWSQSPMFPQYEPSYSFEGMPVTFDHQGMHHQGECTIASQAGDRDGDHVSIKHEHWDNHCI